MARIAISPMVRVALKMLSRPSPTGREVRAELAGDATGNENVATCEITVPPYEELDSFMDSAASIIWKMQDEVRFAEKTYLLPIPIVPVGGEAVRYNFDGMSMVGTRIGDKITLQMAYT